MSASLAHRTWEEIGRPIVVFVPLGSMEQHGPHLPLVTDTAIAERVCWALAEDPACWPSFEKVVAPSIAYGASGEHQDFPGTISIGHEAMSLMLVELTRSLSQWAARTVIVNGHGGNARTLDRVVERMQAEGHRIQGVHCRPDQPVDAHAGHVETSLMLEINPESVVLERAMAGNLAPLDALLPAMRSSGVKAVSSTGVLGDPTTASKEEGRRLLDEMIARAIADLRDV